MIQQFIAAHHMPHCLVSWQLILSSGLLIQSALLQLQINHLELFVQLGCFGSDGMAQHVAGHTKYLCSEPAVYLHAQIHEIIVAVLGHVSQLIHFLICGFESSHPGQRSINLVNGGIQGLYGVAILDRKSTRLNSSH